MSAEVLRRIRENSELTLAKIDKGRFPIKKSLEQLEKETNSMREKIKSSQELHAKAHYLLANIGIDTEFTPVNTNNTFEIVQFEDHTDIKKFLSEEHERILIDIIEDQRNANIEDFEDFVDFQTEAFLEEKDRKRSEEDENMSDLKDYEKDNVNTGIQRINDYAKVVNLLNEDRLINKDFDILRHLSSIRNLSDLKRSQDSANEAWSILTHLINRSGAAGRLEGRFLPDYIVQPYNSSAATKARRSLINASKSYLEELFAQFINDTLNKNAAKTLVGGIPSFTHRLKAYINLAFKTSTGWTDPRFEVVNGLPIWLFIFHLIRSGHLNLAIEYIDSNAEMFVSERKFVNYFQEYVTSDYNCVSKATQDSILADYYQFTYGEQSIDPFKTAVYKLIGRCELHNKNLPEIIHTTEDYLWFKLMLTREVTETERYTFERYRLEDFQKEIKDYGSTYFDKNDSNPYGYFRILLLSLQFEEAINYFYKEKKLRLETVHFTIPLVYCGLLNITPPEKSNTFNLLITGQDNRVTLNLPRLIYQYVKVYLSNQPKDALQYLYLLSLYSMKQGYPNDDMVKIARNEVCKFTLDSKDFKAILGTDDQERIPGLIDSHRDLLHIYSEKEFSNEIIRPIASKCVQTGRCMDAIYAYSLTKDYNDMADILAKELSDALQQPQSHRATVPTLSQHSNTEIIEFAYQTVQNYENNQYISPLIDNTKKVTVRILIQLLQFRNTYEQDEYESALQLIQQANIIPLQATMEEIQLFAHQFNHLAETIKKNIPEILLNVMDCLYKIWATYNSQPTADIPISELEGLERRSRTILTFTGLIQFAIPRDIIIRLNKADMYISARKAYQTRY